MRPPTISAIICTHNRDRYLGKAIDSLLAQDLADFELIVVDNASTDQTQSVIAARKTNPRLRSVYEPTLGLSVARNRGWRESQGEILAYLDDDAIADPNWLGELVRAYQDCDRLAVAGGRISLIWPEGRRAPQWLSTELMAGLGYYNLGNEAIAITEPGLTPRGLNYSIRRSFLETVGGFDAHFGRVGGRLLSNEELVMTEHALNLGWQVSYLPQAHVAHHVTLDRLQPSWFLRRSWWQGVSESYRDNLRGYDWWLKTRCGGERILRGLYKAAQNLHHPAACFDNLTYVYGQFGYFATLFPEPPQQP